MKKFELRKNTLEVAYKDRVNIRKGCTVDVEGDQYPVIITPFYNKEDALESLKAYTSEILKIKGNTGAYYRVTEYYVEENVYNEEGEWMSGGEVLEFAEMPTFGEE